MIVRCDQCGEPLQPLANYCSMCGTQAPQKTILLDEKEQKPVENPVYCPQCGHPAPAHALYCAECGAYLYRLPTTSRFFCPKCREKNRNNAKNCFHCSLTFEDWFSMKGEIAQTLGFKGSLVLHETMNDMYYHFIHDDKVFTLGRNPDNDVVVPAPWVSGKHCRISYSDNRLTDLNSKNGTFINRISRPLKQAVLLDQVKEFNLAGFFTFTTIQLKKAFIFRLTAILNQKLCKEKANMKNLDELRNHYYIFYSGDVEFYIYKINGEIDKVFDKIQEAWCIRILDGFYYFADIQENTGDRLLLKNLKNFPVNWEIQI